MAGRFSKTELKSMLNCSAYRVVATEGIERVTTRKVSKGAGLSDPYIYQCYSDMDDLLKSAFLEINKEIAEIIKNMLQTYNPESITQEETEKRCWEMWSTYWDFLMAQPEKTIFYWRFSQSGYYSKELFDARQKNFDLFFKFLNDAEERSGLTDITDTDTIVADIFVGTVGMAVKIHLGYIEKTESIKYDIYHSVFAVFFRRIGIDIYRGDEQDDE